MDNRVKRIINKESNEIHKCLLLDLIQMDRKNEERILLLYQKY